MFCLFSCLSLCQQQCSLIVSLCQQETASLREIISYNSTVLVSLLVHLT